MKRFKSLWRKWKTHWQHCMLQWGKSILDRNPPPFAQSLQPENIRGILFLRQDGKIGDFIVSSFAFREIKKSYPHIRVGVVCSDKNCDLFVGQPYIDHLHPVKAKSKWSYFHTAKQLAGKYDVVIEPTQALRLRDLILLHFLNAPFNIGLNKADYRLFNLNIDNTQQHYIDIYQNALRLCGFVKLDTRPLLPENAQSKQQVQEFLNKNDLNDGYTAINFFGAARSRRFDDAHIRSILTALLAAFKRQQFVLLSYPPVTAQLVALCQEYPRCFIYENTQTIAENIELIRHAGCVISPDTAIVHIAAALDKPILGLYQNNPQNLANWHPKTQHTELLFFNQHIHEIQAANIVEKLNKLCMTTSVSTSKNIPA